MYLEGRIIAMLDVLGLARRLRTKEELEATAKRYNQLIREAKQSIFSSTYGSSDTDPKVSNFEVGEFVFDNLVLVSHPVDQVSASAFTLSLIKIMKLFASEDMPLRGAMGIGDYHSDPQTGVFLSNIFKELNQEESNQEWAGCIVLERDAEKIIELVNGESALEKQNKACAYLKMEIPAKKPIGERWCLNWIYTLPTSQKEKLFDFLKGDKAKFDGTIKSQIALSNFPDMQTPLSEQGFLPAVVMKYINTCQHIFLWFEDKDGEPAYPPNKFVVKLHA